MRTEYYKSKDDDDDERERERERDREREEFLCIWKFHGQYM